MTEPTKALLDAAHEQFNYWYDKAKQLDEELAKAEERINELEKALQARTAPPMIMSLTNEQHQALVEFNKQGVESFGEAMKISQFEKSTAIENALLSTQIALEALVTYPITPKDD